MSAHEPPEPSSLTQPSQLICPCGAANKCETTPSDEVTSTDLPSALTATASACASGVAVPGTSAQEPPVPSSLTHPSHDSWPWGATEMRDTAPPPEHAEDA